MTALSQDSHKYNPAMQKHERNMLMDRKKILSKLSVENGCVNARLFSAPAYFRIMVIDDINRII